MIWQIAATIFVLAVMAAIVHETFYDPWNRAWDIATIIIGIALLASAPTALIAFIWQA